MSGLFRILLLLFTPVWPVAGMSAGLPPLAGEISGRLELRKFAGAAPLDWRLTLVPPDATMAASRMRLTLAAPGLAAQLEVRADTGDWRVVEGTIDLAVWLRPLAVALEAGLPADLECAGTAKITGEGVWSEGRLHGELAFALNDGRVQRGEWQAAPVVLSASLNLTDGEPALQSAQVRVGEVAGLGLVLSEVELSVVGAGGHRIRVERVTGRMLGGRVTLAPFNFDPAAPAVLSRMELEGLDLAQLRHLLPEALSEASGRVDGRVALDWSLARGVRTGRGELSVRPGTPASLRLAAAPGFLTGQVPPRIPLLPAWLGPLARWSSPPNPVYETLGEIELGRMPLQVEQLRVELHPDGADGARSATVTVAARPAAGAVVERVTFTINVAGPLEQVVRLGLDDRARLNFNGGR
jgi:hypothetical protein